jgi:hypothetical protein
MISFDNAMRAYHPSAILKSELWLFTELFPDVVSCQRVQRRVENIHDQMSAGQQKSKRILNSLDLSLNAQEVLKGSEWTYDQPKAHPGIHNAHIFLDELNVRLDLLWFAFQPASTHVEHMRR